MAQYAVMIFERETPGGAADLPPEVIEAHIALPDRVAELGGPIVAGLALEPSGTATAIRGREVVTDGPFIESKEAIAGVFVLEARDLDHALALAKLTPIVDGGVEAPPARRLPGGGELTRDRLTDRRRRRARGRGRPPPRVGIRPRGDDPDHGRPGSRRGGRSRTRTCRR